MRELINQLTANGISYKTDEPMKLHTSFKTGGDAAVFVEPADEFQLEKTLSICKDLGVETFILGNGSNLLVSDDGIKDKAVIHIGNSLSAITEIDDTTFEVGAGATLAAACKYALSKGLTGLEFAYGIPGSVGGAAFMNAGAYDGEMKDAVLYCNHISKDGVKGRFQADELDFSYRHSAYSNSDLVITSVVFKLKKGDETEIESKMSDFMGRRKSKQPLEYPSAGSVFKRPAGYFAGALIEQAGLKGKRIGGAMVSEKHAGFIINFGGATTKDVTDLISFCQSEVQSKFGVTLETEIRFV